MPIETSVSSEQGVFKNPLQQHKSWQHHKNHLELLRRQNSLNNLQDELMKVDRTRWKCCSKMSYELNKQPFHPSTGRGMLNEKGDSEMILFSHEQNNNKSSLPLSSSSFIMHKSPHWILHSHSKHISTCIMKQAEYILRIM